MPVRLFDQLPDELSRQAHLTLRDFAGMVGNRLGYGWGPHNGFRAWTKQMQLDIAEVVANGQRTAYGCVGLPREMGSHSWSFLRPTITLTLADGADELLLPADVAPQIEGPVVVSSGNGTEFPIAALTNWAAIRSERAANPGFAGAPRLAALEPLDRSGEAPQRHRLVFYPTADADYTVRFDARVQDRLLTEALPYHYGGAQYSDLFQAAIYYAAELFKDNQYQGPMMGHYLDTLVAKVDLDRRTWPKHLGYNGDTSDARWGRRYYRVDRPTTLTISGLSPE